MIMHPLIQTLINDDIKSAYDYFHLGNKIKEEVIPNVFFSRPDIYGLSLILENNKKNKLWQHSNA